jgi:hypothetical protein
MYKLNSNKVGFFEMKLSTSEERDKGYVIVSATKDKFPIVEFNFKGKTYYEEFKELVGSDNFNVVRFGEGYYSCEDNQGNLIAELGIRPVLVPQEYYSLTRELSIDEQSNNIKKFNPDNTDQLCAKSSCNRNQNCNFNYKQLVNNFAYPVLSDREKKIVDQEWELLLSSTMLINFSTEIT